MPNPTTYALVLWGFYPLWLCAAAVDYLCHRRSRIEHTSGAKESQLHLWQFACIGLLILAAALFTASGLMLGLLCLLLLVHTLLSYVDVQYSQPRRHISALEQHVHGFLVVLPIAAIAVIAILDKESVSHHGWVSWRQPALSVRQFSVLVLGLLLGAAPLLEEYGRTARMARPA